jgi:hypothetical protein
LSAAGASAAFPACPSRADPIVFLPPHALDARRTRSMAAPLRSVRPSMAAAPPRSWSHCSSALRALSSASRATRRRARAARNCVGPQGMATWLVLIVGSALWPVLTSSPRISGLILIFWAVSALGTAALSLALIWFLLISKSFQLSFLHFERLSQNSKTPCE